MSNAELGAAIETAWRAAAPLTPESAQQIADPLLVGHPKQAGDFAKWFEVYGATVLEGINRV